MIGEIGAGHEIGIVPLYFKRGITVEQHVGHCVHLALSEIMPPAHMADDVFGFKYVGVEQGELADTRHCQLQGDLSAARTAPGNKYARLTK